MQTPELVPIPPSDSPTSMSRPLRSDARECGEWFGVSKRVAVNPLEIETLVLHERVQRRGRDGRGVVVARYGGDGDGLVHVFEAQASVGKDDFERRLGVEHRGSGLRKR